MDRAEAARVADGVLEPLRALSYQSLVDRLLDEVETEEIRGESGATWQVEVQAFWDSGRPGNLRVLVGVDDGGWRSSFSPLDRAFIIAPDGSFVGE